MRPAPIPCLPPPARLEVAHCAKLLGHQVAGLLAVGAVPNNVRAALKYWANLSDRNWFELVDWLNAAEDVTTLDGPLSIALLR